MISVQVSPDRNNRVSVTLPSRADSASFFLMMEEALG